MRIEMKKIISVVIFLIAAFLGAGIKTRLYGDISIFLTIIIIAVSFGIMNLAVELWKSDMKNEN